MIKGYCDKCNKEEDLNKLYVIETHICEKCLQESEVKQEETK